MTTEGSKNVATALSRMNSSECVSHECFNWLLITACCFVVRL